MFSSAPIRKAYRVIRAHTDIAAMVYLKSQSIDEVLNGLAHQSSNSSSINAENRKAVFSICETLYHEPHLFLDTHLRKIETVIEGFRERIVSIRSSREGPQKQVSATSLHSVPEVLKKLLPDGPLGSLELPGSSGQAMDAFLRALSDLADVMVGQDLTE